MHGSPIIGLEATYTTNLSANSFGESIKIPFQDQRASEKDVLLNYWISITFLGGKKKNVFA